MSQFKDGKGSTWDLNITVESIKRVKQSLDVDLGNIHQGNPPLSARLDTDVVLLIDVIYVLLKPAADAKGIDDAEFGESLGGDSAWAAREAFWRALIDFFQKFHRTDAVAAIEKQLSLVEAVINKASQKIQGMSIEQTATEIIQNSGKPFIDGPALSESIQAP